MRGFRQMVIGLVVGLALVPSTNAAASAFTPGFDLTADAQFEHRYIYQDNGDQMTVKVDPLACVKFGRGLDDSITVEMNGKADTAYRDEEDLSELVHTQTCELALFVGQSLDPLIMPESESEEDHPIYVGKYSDTNTVRIGMRVRPMKKIDMKGEHPMYIHYEEQGVAKTLYFPLPACVNPDAEGEIIIDNGSRQFHESLQSVAKNPKLNKLLGKACVVMAAPYAIVKDNPELYPSAKRIVNKAYVE